MLRGRDHHGDHEGIAVDDREQGIADADPRALIDGAGGHTPRAGRGVPAAAHAGPLQIEACGPERGQRLCDAGLAHGLLGLGDGRRRARVVEHSLRLDPPRQEGLGAGERPAGEGGGALGRRAPCARHREGGAGGALGLALLPCVELDQELARGDLVGQVDVHPLDHTVELGGDHDARRGLERSGELADLAQGAALDGAELDRDAFGLRARRSRVDLVAGAPAPRGEREDRDGHEGPAVRAAGRGWDVRRFGRRFGGREGRHSVGLDVRAARVGRGRVVQRGATVNGPRSRLGL